MAKFNVGDKVRVKVTSSYYGTRIDTTKQYTVFEIYDDTGRVALKPHYLVVRESDVEPWIDDTIRDSAVTVWTDKNGVTREYREVKRKANVGDVVKITNAVSWDVMAGNYTDGDVYNVKETRMYDNRTVIDARHGERQLFDEEYVVLEPTGIVIHDGKRYREVKRKARVGEKIMITSDRFPSNYDIGEIFTVDDVGRGRPRLDDGIYVNALKNRRGENVPGFVHDGKYVVLEPVIAESTSTPSVTLTGSNVSDRITSLETEVSTLKSRVAALETKVTPITLTMSTNVNISGGAKYTREEVVEMAKKDVETLTKRAYADPYPRDIPLCAEAGPLTVKFHVNRRKRTVTALCFRKHVAQNDVRGKGIAHCAPDDCFNVYIGKAIALRRALGLDVPSYYTSAPKPTKVNVGDIIMWDFVSAHYKVISVSPADIRGVWSRIKGYSDWKAYVETSDFQDAIILDDSHDFGGDGK